MSNTPILPPTAPPQRPVRQIRGPQSALTDFLASHNINANQIRQDAEARRAAALASRQQAEGSEDASASAEPEPEPEPAAAPKRRKETKAQLAKRKKEEEKAIAKIKASKQFQRRRRQYGSDDEVTDEDDAARAYFEENMAPLPGQMENCDVCDKRFSVTAYSRTGPDGGLLCLVCTKELDKEEGAARKKRKLADGEKRQQRRKIQSQLLDGIYPGAKDLVTLCVETLAKNVDMAESFGDLPTSLVEKLSAILSKKRLINSQTLDLFLRPGADTITVYDGAKLNSDDYIRIFQIVPTVKHLKIRNGVQFKNKVIDHILGTTVSLETFDIHGANLIDDERWDSFIRQFSKTLKCLKIHFTDGHFGDDQVELVSKTCPLQRLKISHNSKVTDKGIEHIANISTLRHLSIEIYIPPGVKELTSDPFVKVLTTIGPELRTFSLETVPLVTDNILQAIHDNCRNLSKLRLTDNKEMSDNAFAALFTDWPNPPLEFIDFSKCRHLDAAEPRENPSGIGFGSAGFEALMAHSGETIKHLDVHSCRHISLETFEKVFAEDKTYPALEWMDVSFCQSVNDYVVGRIFAACPQLKYLKVFGNFGVRDIRVPKGRILVGVPNALGMNIEGTEDGEGRII